MPITLDRKWTELHERPQSNLLIISSTKEENPLLFRIIQVKVCLETYVETANETGDLRFPESTAKTNPILFSPPRGRITRRKSILRSEIRNSTAIYRP